MNENLNITFLAITIGLISAIYWLLKVKSRNASISSLMILWGAFILIQILGFIASFTVLSQSLIAVLFIFSSYKLGLVIREKDHQRQREHMEPMQLDAR